MHIQNILNCKIWIRLAIMLYSLKIFHKKSVFYKKSVFHKTVFFSLHKTVFKCLPFQHQYFINTKDVFWVFCHVHFCLSCVRYSTFWIYVWCCHWKFYLRPPVPIYVTWGQLGFLMFWKHKFTISATYSSCCS